MRHLYSPSCREGSFSETQVPASMILGNLALSCVAVCVLCGRCTTQDYITGRMVKASLFSELPGERGSQILVAEFCSGSNLTALFFTDINQSSVSASS